MARGGLEIPAETSAASARRIEHARRSVAQVRLDGRAAGAAVIWDAQSLALADDRVVAGDRRKVQVILYDGRGLDATLRGRSRGRNRGLDLALLRVGGAPGALPAAPVGDSDSLRVGEPVFAIGHPWGRPGVVATGVVSGVRAGRSTGGAARHIESDVAPAPGNSGGPLLNARGETSFVDVEPDPPERAA